MANSQRLTTIRLAIEGYLASQIHQSGGVLSEDGVAIKDEASGEAGFVVDCVIASESILIRDEHYCGWRFSTSTHRAVWFIEEDQVKIYTADQRLCCVLNTEAIDAAADSVADSSPDVISIHSMRVDSDDRDSDEGSEEFRRAA